MSQLQYRAFAFLGERKSPLSTEWIIPSADFNGDVFFVEFWGSNKIIGYARFSRISPNTFELSQLLPFCLDQEVAPIIPLTDVLWRMEAAIEANLSIHSFLKDQGLL